VNPKPPEHEQKTSCNRRLVRAHGLRGSICEAVAPIVRVKAVVLEGKDTKIVGKNPVVDGVWKSRHEVRSDICLDDSPTLGSFLNDSNRAPCSVKKLGAECRNPALVKLCRFDELRLGIGVVDQEPPRERRAASMTSSCVRPTTAPEESSRSRRTASRTASRSPLSTDPASMLCQSA